jgi:DNA-directed RNA polymerase specialized sigma24 family protein
MSEELKHYGVKRRSGRYPWGSGDDPQRSKDFRSHVNDLKKQGVSEIEIAKAFGFKTTKQLRDKISIAKADQLKADIAQAIKLRDKGYSNVKIGEIMGGVNESTVRSWLNPTLKERANMTETTASILKDSIDKKGLIDVGSGVERHMGVSRTRLKTAISMLEEEGYLVTYVPIEQVGTGKNTTTMVLSKPKKNALEIVKLKNQGLSEKEIAKETGLNEETVRSRIKESFSEVFKNKDNIKMITDYSEDGGKSFRILEPVRSVDPKRIMVRYAEDGGKDKDGVIEVRRGVADISLGDKKYAQVRIGVDGTHYMKGMAMYGEDLPKGVDIVYNTNKDKSVPMLGPKNNTVCKLMEKDKDGNIDTDNPFGASVRQKHYFDKNGKEQLSALNIVGLKEGTGEEGAWETWSRTLSSQFLSKQPTALDG